MLRVAGVPDPRERDHPERADRQQRRGRDRAGRPMPAQPQARDLGRRVAVRADQQPGLEAPQVARERGHVGVTARGVAGHRLLDDRRERR